MSSDLEEPETEPLKDGDGPSGGLRILALWDEEALAFPLPDAGTVTVGRAEDVELRIGDPSISRRHVRFHVSPRLSVEDLRSANGTSVRGRTLNPGETVEVKVGEVIELGRTMLVVQRAWSRASAGAPGRMETPVPVAFRDGTMKSLGPLLERVAASSMAVLIMGETGVGKGILAAELHRKSRRAKGPYVAVNCAALPASLTETELFGHVRGAYSGADKDKAGLIETADGGTLVLDEVAELPLPAQASLLKVLDDFDVRRVGGLKGHRVDVRLITCTNRDLEAEVQRGTFREDLFFRLAKIPLFVPPLRERTSEIEELARAFLAEACASEGMSVPVLSPEVLAALRKHRWPGNVRELRSAIERAVLQCTDGVIRVEHLTVARLRTSDYAAAPRDEDAADAERKRIAEALAQCGGNQRRAAELLGYSLRTLVNRLRELGLPRPRPKKK
jgi:two-component system, NtrC family, response regulator AtoC